MTRAASVRRVEYEHEQRFDPLNRLLDAFEQNLIGLIGHGLEPQIRTRLDRLLPRARVRSSDDRKLEYANLLAFLRTQGTRRHTAAEHERWQHFAQLISSELTEMQEAA